MNLNKLLAENMVRFGTKNLSGNILRTLLNEGSKAGEKSQTNPDGYLLTNYTTTNASIGTWLQPYSNVDKALGIPTGKLTAAAAVAIASAFKKALDANKKLQKSSGYLEGVGMMTVPAIYNDLAGVGYAGLEGRVQKMESLTKTITYTSKLVDIYPAPGSSPDRVATIGNVDNSTMAVQRQEKQDSTSYNVLVKYLNQFNLGNVFGLDSDVDFTQYDLSAMLDANNYINMLSTTTAPNKLIVYSVGDKIPAVAAKELTSTTVGASGPVTKQYDVSFDTGVSTIPANDTAVSDAVKDAIAMFPDGNITNLTVVSSASPEYNAAAGGPKTLADYGQTPTSGTGDPGAGTTDIAKNIKLAYDRGVSFMGALNAGLAAAGKPQVTSYTVNWQISDKGGQKVPGRYAEVQWEKAGSKGTEVPGAKDVGTTGAVTNLRTTYNVKQHEFSW